MSPPGSAALLVGLSVIEQNRTVDDEEDAKGGAQNLSVIENELIQESEFDLFLGGSGLSANTQVLLWVFGMGFSALTVLLMWIGSSGRHARSGRGAEIMLVLTVHFFVVTLGYLGMALGVGLLHEVVGVRVADGIVETPGDIITKVKDPPVFWVRHVSWGMSTPLQLLLVAYVADEVFTRRGAGGRGAEGGAGAGGKARVLKRIPLDLKIYLLGLNTCMHACGAIATLVPVVQVGKWTYWVLGIALFFMLGSQLYSREAVLRRTAVKNGTDADYLLLARFTLFSWTLYPIVWAISDGSRTVDADIREGLYAFVEALNKLGFLSLFLAISSPPNTPRWLQWTSSVAAAIFGRRRRADELERGQNSQSMHGSEIKGEFEDAAGPPTPNARGIGKNLSAGRRTSGLALTTAV